MRLLATALRRCTATQTAFPKTLRPAYTMTRSFVSDATKDSPVWKLGHLNHVAIA
ncbi:hypothetical protein FBU59_000748, partial [Linderina macrospora]